VFRREGSHVDAGDRAAERADQLPNETDMAAAETWQRILDAIERL